MSLVKQYLYAEWSKMHLGWEKVHLRDFIFSKEVRMGHYAVDSSGAPKSQPPGAVVACKLMAKDPMAEPPYRWRVPYVVVYGPPKTLLRDLVVTPEEVLCRNSQLRINHLYYITKCINPALDRVFALCGVDVFEWYRLMIKPKQRLRRSSLEDSCFPTNNYFSNNSNSNSNNNVLGTMKQRKLDAFFRVGLCQSCGADGCFSGLCDFCASDPGGAMARVMNQIRECTVIENTLAKVCYNCSKHSQNAEIKVDKPTDLYDKHPILISSDGCVSLDCPIFFERCRRISRLVELVAGEKEVTMQLST